MHASIEFTSISVKNCDLCMPMALIIPFTFMMLPKCLAFKDASQLCMIFRRHVFVSTFRTKLHREREIRERETERVKGLTCLFGF